MKKTFPLLLLGAALGSATIFAACGSSADSNATKETTSSPSSETTGATEGQILGGWTLNTETEPHISADAETVFKKASDDSSISGLTAVARVASQLVAGTNHAFLCADTSNPAWKMVTVYEDLQGNAKVIGTFDMDPTAIETTEETEDTDIVGGWTVLDEGAAALPSDAQKAYDEASKAYTGLSLKPIALLATQLVNGTNYKILCNGTVVVPDATPMLYIVDINKDSSGVSTIIDVQKVLLTKYVGQN